MREILEREMKVSDQGDGFHSPTRRKVIKGAGAVLGAAGLNLASTIAAPAVWAAGVSKVKVVNSAGTISQLLATAFKELKIFEKYDIDAELLNVSDGNKVLASIISGDVDICGAAGFNGLFPAIEKGAKLKVLAGASLAPNTILMSGQPDIKSVKDLPGRTVGTGLPGALLHEQVVAVLDKYGVDYKTVNFVNAGSSADIFRTLAAGQVDAGVVSIELQETADKYKLHVVDGGLFYKEIPQYTIQAMFSSDATIAAKREGLTRVLAAHADAFRWMSNPANKDEFLRIYAQTFTSSSPEQRVFFQKFTSSPGALATDLTLTEDNFKFVQGLNVELGAQKTVLPFDQVADMSLARDALKLVKA